MPGNGAHRSGGCRGKTVRVAFLLGALALLLGACGWFGHKDDQSAAAAQSQAQSTEILKKDCGDEQWKQANLGLWYSVCRQPMRW
jgi:hypothetical protein